MKIATTLMPVILIATIVFLISFHYNKVNSDFQPKDTLGIGKQVCDVMNCDTAPKKDSVITVIVDMDDSKNTRVIYNGCVDCTDTDTIPLIKLRRRIITTYPPQEDTIPEINYGGETGFLNSKSYKEAQEKYDSDTITNSELDYSDTYTNHYHDFIINKGEVFFRADVVGEEERAKEVLATLKKYLEEGDRKVNQ